MTSKIYTDPIGVRSRQNTGFCLMLTGLSAAGKTELAKAFEKLWEDRSGEKITMLDGDETRKIISSELGFSKEDREKHVERLAYVARVAVSHGAGSLMAIIAPYEASRVSARKMIEDAGGVFGLIHISTPLAVCEERDPKGLYKKARAKEIKHFTGVSDPFEKPKSADLNLDMSKCSSEEGAAKLVEWLVDHLSKTVN